MYKSLLHLQILGKLYYNGEGFQHTSSKKKQKV